MVYYGQRDARWSNEIMGFGVSSIGSVGCYLTSLCNGLNTKGYFYTPFTLNDLLKQTGSFDLESEFKNYVDAENVKNTLPNIFINYTYVDPWNDQPNLDEILKPNVIALGKVSGKPIGGSSTHFVLITGKSSLIIILIIFGREIIGVDFGYFQNRF